VPDSAQPALQYRPLAGLRVVDMADEKAELCGRLMADLGADVVRVEPPGGAVSRRLPPFHDGASLYFEVRNANKRGAVIDIDSPQGRDALLDLLGEADIWVETTRPGELARRGLDPAAISARLPELVVVSVTDFGQTGPYRDFVATDAVMEALAWMLFRAGVPELPPVLPPGPMAYDLAGVSAAYAALTAYLERANTGAGQYIDMSVMEAAAQTTDWGLTSYSVISKFAQYGELREGGGKAYPVIACKDGFVRVGMVTVAEWRKLRAWIGEAGLSPDVVQQDDWDDQRTRLEVFDDLLRPVFEEFFRDRTMMDLAVGGQDRGIPITPMLTPADVLVAEQFEALGSFVDGLTPNGATGRFASGFVVVDGERIGWRHRAPDPAIDGRTGAGDWTGARVPAGGGRPVEVVTGRPYHGLTVLEFGVAGAVPEIGRLLAEYGAEVIRIESPKRTDIFRQLGGPNGVGGVFVSSNRSTKSIGVDFTQPAGAQIVKELVARADMLLENLPPGTLERFGLGPDELRRAKPSLLVVSSQTMGRRGPWSHWRGYGSNTQLPGGMSWLWSFPDLPEPVPQNVAFPDHLVGRLGAFVAAADLVGRRQGAPGAGHVEVVQAEMALNLLADLFLEESLEPGSVKPLGNRSVRGAPWGVYPCAGNQRWCVITCRDDADWMALVGAMGRPEWALESRFRALAGRRAEHDFLDERISEWSSQRTDREVMTKLQSAGVPAGKMMYISDQPQDPHFLARGYVLSMEQPGLGEVLLEGAAFHGNRLPAPITFPAPFLGQHTREICASLLGYSDARIGELLDAGVLVEAAATTGTAITGTPAPAPD
jgi:crotonobetainyl-CoA:carnitine CoA-transferase CaiB-like acyl-CoA transferase